jgi:hypothetical protein
LNAIVLKKGVTSPNFKGFMGDNAKQIGMLSVLFMGLDVPTMKLIDKKHTCFFH